MTHDEWEQLRSHVAAAKSLPELRRRLMYQAERLGKKLIDGKTASSERLQQRRRRRLDEWKWLGIDAKTSDMKSSGASRFEALQKLVLVRVSDLPQRQRFTVAHEIGHYFVSAVSSGHVDVTHAQEEALCDEFASRLLLPPTELVSATYKFGPAASIDDLLSLCRQFDVGLQPMLIALREVLTDTHPIFLVASLRGHPKRKDIQGYRIDAVANPPMFYIAKDQRLSSIGLEKIAEWADGASGSQCGEGRSNSFRIKLWDRDRHRSGVATGAAQWQARRLSNAGLLLVRVTPDDLKVQWAPEKRGAEQ